MGDTDLLLAFLTTLGKSSGLEQEEETGMVLTGILWWVNKPPL